MKRRFTKEEDLLILEHITKNHYNISNACKELAESGKIDRDYKSILTRWYYKLRFTKHCYMTVGGQYGTLNMKNVFKGKEKTHLLDKKTTLKNLKTVLNIYF